MSIQRHFLLALYIVEVSHSFTLAARVSILIDFISPFHRFVSIIECAWDAHIAFFQEIPFISLLEIRLYPTFRGYPFLQFAGVTYYTLGIKFKTSLNELVFSYVICTRYLY